jgi:hypothetical protein
MWVKALRQGCAIVCINQSPYGAPAMSQTARRNRLLPWYIGIAIIVAAELVVGYQMFYVGCPAPVLLELAMLIVIPVVYLVLMYLTFISQE